jgi:hypothetical protein
LGKSSSFLKGQFLRFPADVQCRLRYGPSSRQAPLQRQRDICRDLHCRRDHFTWTSHPALEVRYSITIGCYISLLALKRRHYTPHWMGRAPQHSTTCALEMRHFSSGSSYPQNDPSSKQSKFETTQDTQRPKVQNNPRHKKTKVQNDPNFPRFFK